MTKTFMQGTGKVELQNASDLVIQGLDPKTPSPLLRLRFQVKNDLPRAISASAVKNNCSVPVESI